VAADHDAEALPFDLGHPVTSDILGSPHGRWLYDKSI
jgi:hypothetical protein